MNHIFAGKIVRRCDFSGSGGLRHPLLFHQLRAGKTQLHTAEGVNLIINAAVVWTEAAQHLRVGGIDNGITGKGGNISLPKVNTAARRL